MPTVTPPAPAKLLTESEAAEILAVNIRTLQGWRTRRVKLPFTKLGSCVRYRLADIEAFMKRNVVEVEA